MFPLFAHFSKVFYRYCTFPLFVHFSKAFCHFISYTCTVHVSFICPLFQSILPLYLIYWYCKCINYFLYFFFSKNHLSVTSDVIICAGYTIFEYTLNLKEYIVSNNSINKCLVKVQAFAACLLGKKSTEQKLSFSHATLLLDLIYVPTKNYQTVWELWPAKDFSIRGDTYIMEKVRVLLNTTCLLVLIYASTKYYQTISNHIHKNLA